jgi:hypothetical protein
VIEYLRVPFARVDWIERIGDVVADTRDGEETSSEERVFKAVSDE